MSGKYIMNNLDERVKQNLAAITMLSKLQQAEADSKFTQDAKGVLKKYSGWGGLKDAFYMPQIYKELKHHFLDEQIKQFKDNASNSYYTPELLIRFIWAALGRMGFTQVASASRKLRILEPSAGIGSFIEHMPETLLINSDINAIEVDSNSCRYLRVLYLKFLFGVKFLPNSEHRTSIVI